MVAVVASVVGVVAIVLLISAASRLLSPRQVDAGFSDHNAQRRADLQER